MHESDPQAINAATRTDLGFDTRDLTIAGLWKHIVGFFIFTAFMIALVWASYRYTGMWTEEGNYLRGRVEKPIIPASPNPLIQDGHYAKLDIMELRTQEQSALHGYGWTDESKGIAHIPIERAISMAAEKGLAPQSPPVIELAASNSGGSPR